MLLKELAAVEIVVTHDANMIDGGRKVLKWITKRNIKNNDSANHKKKFKNNYLKLFAIKVSVASNTLSLINPLPLNLANTNIYVRFKQSAGGSGLIRWNFSFCGNFRAFKIFECIKFNWHAGLHEKNRGKPSSSE